MKKTITLTPAISSILSLGVSEVVQQEELEKLLANSRKLVVKFGIDPTAADIHLGHIVPLLKLKQLEDLGH
jgi:tyrosyl-tRNA synthetase